MAKGGKWERDVARDLSEWLGAERNPPVLWRSELSGGWEHRTIPNVGDLAPRAPDGRQEGFEFRRRFAVECKHRKDQIDWWHIFSSKSPDVLEWWSKISAEAYEYDLCPLLIAKRNYYPTVIGMPNGLLRFNDADRWLTIPHAGLTFMEYERFLELEVEHIYEMQESWAESAT